MEIIIQDVKLGPVFDAIDLGNPGQPLRVECDTIDWLSCHATGRTEHVPRVFVRSVYPDAESSPLLAMGSGQVTHHTPIEERRVGYYVTGTVSLPHLGNRTYEEDRLAEPSQCAWPDLDDKIDTATYLRSTSDVVALMVLVRLRKIFEAATADDEYSEMNLPERHEIAAILGETGVW
ncbi:MAG: hypothetical protein WEB53_07930 [Akkermansiaceae bacterium]